MEGFEDYHKKLSNALKKERTLDDLVSQCDDCEFLLKEDLNEAMSTYISQNYDLLTESLDRNAFESDIGTLAIAEHFDPRIQDFTYQDIQVVDAISSDLVLSIVDQIRYQSDTFEAFGLIGGDHDGTSSESSNDSLLADLRMIGLLSAIGSTESDPTSVGDDTYLALHNVMSRVICNPHQPDE